MAGLIAARIACRDGSVVAPEDVSSHSALSALLSGASLPKYGGLYVGAVEGKTGTVDFGVAPLSDEHGDVVGVVIEYGLVQLIIMLRSSKSDHERLINGGLMHRPWCLNLFLQAPAHLGSRRAPILLSWPDAPRREFPVLNLQVEATRI